jgi:hypothetical protein
MYFKYYFKGRTYVIFKTSIIHKIIFYSGGLLPLKLVPNLISESTVNSIIAPSANFKGKGPVPVPEITFI